MKRFVFIRHDNDSNDDRIAGYLKHHRISVENGRPHCGDRLDDFDHEVAVTVIYGGMFNVYEEVRHPFLYEEHRWIESFLKYEIPLLGICQGAQSIAHVFDAYASPTDAGGHEFGYYPIKPTEAGRSYFPDQLVVPLAHFHAFQIPDGAVRLASSELFSNQVMRVGEACFAFLFHPEVTPDISRIWQDSDREHHVKPGAQSRPLHDELIAIHDSDVGVWLNRFLDSWISDLVAQQGSAMVNRD